MSTLSTRAPSCSRQSVLRVRPLSAVWCRTTVSSPGSSASASASRAAAGHVGHLRGVGDAAVVVPGQLVGAERRVPELGDRRARLLAGEVGEVARGHAPAGGVEDEGEGSHGVVHGPTWVNPASVREAKLTLRCHAASHEPAGRRRPDAAPEQEGGQGAADRGPGAAGRTCACCSAARSARGDRPAAAACCSRAGTPRARAAPSSVWSSQLDPRHVRVAQFAAPTYDEKRHHFLWRFWPALPGWGGMAVLDRTWYGRVLVERVEGFASEEAWQRAYGEIVDLETTLAAEGTILVKFWMHVSPEEQLRRFESRRDDPYGRGSSPTRTGATARSAPSTRPPSRTCSSAPTTPAGPWHVVAAEDKRWARVDVVRTVCEAIETAWPSGASTPIRRSGRASSPVPGRRAAGPRRASRCRPPAPALIDRVEPNWAIEHGQSPPRRGPSVGQPGPLLAEQQHAPLAAGRRSRAGRRRAGCPRRPPAARGAARTPSSAGDVRVVAHVLVPIGDHRSAPVPAAPADDVHLGGEERVRRPHHRPDVEVVAEVLDRHVEAGAAGVSRSATIASTVQ